MDSKPSKNVALEHPSHFEVVFEDYLFYAALQQKEDGGMKITSETTEVIDEARGLPPLSPDEQERVEATRALRMTSWISVFYLLTTDMSGSVLVPYTISQVGWVPGVVLFVFLGILSSYSGILLWSLFLRLDSLRYPLKTYADVAERIYGRFARHICNILQTIQLLTTVGGASLVLGQGLSQITRGRLCFSVCVVIFPIASMIIGQVRMLKNVSMFATFTVWSNIAIMCMTMAVVSHSSPNYSGAERSLGVSPGPVVTESFTNLSFYSKVNGIMYMVGVYSGAMIFPEIMAEMKRPMDFWKCLALTETLIVTVYLLYGCFVYAFQGQFTMPIAYQGMSIYVWQTVANSVSLVGGAVVMGFYGNIAIKVIYINIIEDTFKGPRFMSFKGRFVWTGLVIVYWMIAFTIGSAVRQIQTIGGFVGAVAIMQFTFTFPPLLWLGYQVVTDAMIEDKAYCPGNGSEGRIDTWKEWSRWKRGLFGGRWYLKMFNLVLALAGFATACMGMWAAGSTIRATFAISGAATSFGCTAPV